MPALSINTKFFIQLNVAAKMASSITAPSTEPAISIHAILANIDPEHNNKPIYTKMLLLLLLILLLVVILCLLSAFVPSADFSSEISPGRAASPIGLQKKKFWGLLVRDVLQTSCCSCHPTNNIEVLKEHTASKQLIY